MGSSSLVPPSAGRHRQIVRGPPANLPATATTSKGAVRTQGHALGDGNNAGIGYIRSEVLPPLEATGNVHRLDGDGLGRAVAGLVTPQRPRHGLRYSRTLPAMGAESMLVAGSCRSFPQDSSVVFSFMR